MYRCSDNLKGCLDISVHRIGDKIKVSANNLNEDIKIFVKPIRNKVIVTCSLICTINKSAYLNVNPDYVWLTPDMLSSGEFDIISNINWNIV